MPIRPPHLRPGDTLGIVAPASAPADPKNIDRGVLALEQLGFKVKLAPHVRKRLGFLAGNDRDRAGDLMRMFTDREVNAILCIRGGYGTTRLLPLLDYRVIRNHAKIFVGYSDLTALHCALLTRANLISFHGPMLNADFARKDMPDFTLQSILRTLCPVPVSDARQLTSVSQGYHRKTVQILRRGLAEGQLIGGNLTLLCNIIATPWQPPFKNRILFFEDLGEEPYRFDRMLTYLLNCGRLQQVAGIAIGINRDCEDPKAKKPKEYRQTLKDIFRERLIPLKIPVVMGLPFGHVPHNATLPIGAQAVLDGNRGELFLTKSVVS
jgi:muramoyltetrapeptide carboxypeptidase